MRLSGNALAARNWGRGEGAGKWNTIFVAGTFHRADFPGGVLKVTTECFNQMIANWKKAGGNALPIDQFHWGDSNDTRIRAEDKKAKGWIEDLRVSDDGQALEALISWTADGKADIEGDRLRYFSPSFAPDWPDRQTGHSQGWTLFGGGLLNDPYLTELPRMAATANPNPAAQEPHTMKILMKKLIDALNAAGIKLAHDALEPEVVVAFDAYVAQVLKTSTEHGDVVKLNATLKPQAEAVEPLKVELAASKTQVADLTTKLAAANEKLQTTEKNAKDASIQAAWDKLIAAKEVLPAKKDNFVEVALALGVEKAIKSFGGQKVVPDGELGTGGSADVGGQTEAKKKLNALAAEHVKANPDMKMSDALRTISLAHPELVAQANPKPTAVKN